MDTSSNKLTIRFSHILFLFVAISAILFSKTLTYPFVEWDDQAYVTENPRIQEPGGEAWWNIVDPGLALRNNRVEYLPLLEITYRGVRQIFGTSPFGFHLINILLHLAASLLLVCLLQVLGFHRFFAGSVGLLFLTHPLHVESVAWVSGLKDPLAACFLFLGLIVYIRYAKQPRRACILSWIALLCAIGSRNTSVIWIALAFLCDRWTGARRVKESIHMLTPHFLLILGSSWLNYQIGSNQVVKTYLEGSFWVTLMTMAKVMLAYLGKLLIPINLSAHYKPTPITSTTDFWFLGSIGILFLVVASIVLFGRRHKIVWFAFFWFAFSIAPFVNVIPLSIQMADRYLYIAIMGYLLLLVWLILKIRHQTLRHTAIILLAVVYGFLSFQRAEVWSSNLHLWKDAAAKAPLDVMAWNNYGKALAEEKNFGTSVRAYRYLVNMAPWKKEAWNNLGRVLLLFVQSEPSLPAEKRQQLLEEAQSALNMALTKDTDYTQAYNNLGSILWQIGLEKKDKQYLVEAKRRFERALQIDPDYPAASRNLKTLEKQLRIAVRGYTSARPILDY